MVTTLIIDHTLEDLDDWPLRAEVNRYRYYTNDLAAKHRTLVQLRAEIRTTTGELVEKQPLTRRIAWRQSGGRVGLGPSEGPADSSQ